MTDLRSIADLQARVYAFLAAQDEATLAAIISGTVELAVRRADKPASAAGFRPAPVNGPGQPSKDVQQTARDLPLLASPAERQIYLNATGLNMDGLRQVAKLLGLKRYGKLTRPKLLHLLAGDELTAPPPAQPQPQPQTTIAVPAAASVPEVDAAAIALRLREIDTEDEGAEYLASQRLSRDVLLAVAAELQLSRVDRLNHADLEKKVLKQAIGARRKFAGLRRW
jgi:hypothetical protein